MSYNVHHLSFRLIGTLPIVIDAGVITITITITITIILISSFTAITIIISFMIGFAAIVASSSHRFSSVLGVILIPAASSQSPLPASSELPSSLLAVDVCVATVATKELDGVPLQEQFMHQSMWATRHPPTLCFSRP